MLRQRVLTAIALLVPALALIFKAPPAGLAVALVVVAALAAAEWARLAQLQAGPGRSAYIALITLLSAAAAAAFLYAPQWHATQPLLAAAALWWLLALGWILRQARVPAPAPPSAAVRLAIGVLVVPATITGLLQMRSGPWGPWGLLTVFGIVWAADIGAYFAGRAFGRHKLAPAVSPGKTWEGFAGGLLAALLVGWAAGTWLAPAPPRPWSIWLGLTAVVAAISVVGDLTESLLKRIAGVKDSGTLLPGHGGVLDRIDSVLAAAPVMALGIGLLGG